MSGMNLQEILRSVTKLIHLFYAYKHFSMLNDKNMLLISVLYDGSL